MQNYASGYTGYSTYGLDDKHRPSVYCITDVYGLTLTMIPLTVGTFSTMASVIEAGINSYTKIRILPISIEYDYFSDIYNTITFAQKMFKDTPTDIKWIFPKGAPYHSEEFDAALYRSNIWQFEGDTSINFTFIPKIEDKLYDIRMYTLDGSKHFMSKCSVEELSEMSHDFEIDEIHISGTENRHGGICAIDISDSNEIDISKLRLYNIYNDATLKYLRKKYYIGYDKERWVI